MSMDMVMARVPAMRVNPEIYFGTGTLIARMTPEPEWQSGPTRPYDHTGDFKETAAQVCRERHLDPEADFLHAMSELQRALGAIGKGAADAAD